MKPISLNAQTLETGFEASYSVASVIRKMFSSALELPTEESIEE